MNDTLKINENERKVLEQMVKTNANHGDTHYMYFRVLADYTGLDLKQVSRACRSLKKKGLAEYMRGLFDEDGRAAGSGYGATADGEKLIGTELGI